MKELPINQIICGDALMELRKLPDESIDCVICSPPYWGLRDYGTAKWEGGDMNCEHEAERTVKREFHQTGATGRGSPTTIIHTSQMPQGGCVKCGAKHVDAQLGLEKTPEEYVAKMVEVFREVRRVLKREGTLWLNLGDSYSGSGVNDGNTNAGISNAVRRGDVKEKSRPNTNIVGLKPKDLVGIPWRISFALQADGWYLRQDLIWAKPNPMPESVTDRCTKSHEYVFLLTKSPKYYYDAVAIKEPYTAPMNRWGGQKLKADGESTWDKGTGQVTYRDRDMRPDPNGRNKRSVWTITTKPFKEAHFATFPEDLVVPMIKAGTSEKGVCPDCGKVWVRIIEKRMSERHESELQTVGSGRGEKADRGKHSTPTETKTLGWQPTCKCGKEPIPAVVLDPFIGSGTVGLVAKKLGRNYIGIDLSKVYCEMARKRIGRTPKRLI